jgi:hypothetical protein
MSITPGDKRRTRAILLFADDLAFVVDGKGPPTEGVNRRVVRGDEIVGPHVGRDQVQIVVEGTRAALDLKQLVAGHWMRVGGVVTPALDMLSWTWHRQAAIVAGVPVVVRRGAVVIEPSASRDPAPVPRVRDLFALYMTCITAALVVLTVTADLDVLLLHPPVMGLVDLLAVVAPLETVLLGAFTSLVTFSVVRRKPHGGHVEYYSYRDDGGNGGGQDLQFTQVTSRASHTSGILGALLQLLTGRRRSRRLPMVSTALLLVCLPLAAVPHVPSTTPASAR